MTRGLASKGLCAECTAPLILERPATGDYLHRWVSDQLERRRTSGALDDLSVHADLRAWAEINEPIPASKHAAPSVKNFRPSTAPPLIVENSQPAPSVDIERGIGQLVVARAVATVLLVGFIAFSTLEVWSSFTWESRDAGYFDMLTTIEGLSWVFYLATGVAFVIWSYRAHANLDLLGRGQLTHDHRATIWWWVVPIAFLWMPYRVIFETARGSTAPLTDPHWRQVKLPPVVLWWTASFLTGIIATRGAVALINQAETYEQLDSAITANGYAYLLWGAAAALAISMIWQISDAQRVLATQRSLLETTEAHPEHPTLSEHQRDRPQRSFSPEEASIKSADDAVFCPSCGHEFAKSDAFCAKCGARRPSL